MRQEFSLSHSLVEFLIDLILIYVNFFLLKFLSITQLILAILIRKHLQIRNDGSL